MRRHWRFVLLIFFVGLWGWSLSTPAYAQHTVNNSEPDSAATGISTADTPNGIAILLPPNFIGSTVVSHLSFPTDMVILPNGDFLVTEKGTGSHEFSRAKVRLVRAGVLLPAPVLTLSVNSFIDSGLMSIILDPDFASNHEFYLWYSTGVDALGWTGTTTDRLSRFVYDADTGTASLASETIILDGVPWAMIHNGGGLLFDDEGNLLLATGDANSVQVPAELNWTQSLTSLNGKVLRIRPRPEGGYDVPADNPFVGKGQGIRAEIYAYGLRNPFRMTRRLTTRQIYLVDLGEETWDEINLLAPGLNYGWPVREGNCGRGERENNCTANPGQFSDPLVAYPHLPNQGGCLTALAFYEGLSWPAAYQDQLFFSDYNNGLLGSTAAITPTQSFSPFATQAGSVVDLEATPEGLYAVSIYDGAIWFLHYGEGDSPPSVRLTTSYPSGKAPLTVQFTARAADVDDQTLTYQWDFGDGSLTATTVPTVTHQYTEDGDYLATLQVEDGHGEKSEIVSAPIQVYSGAMAKIVPVNLSRPNRALYHGGDRIQFSVARTGGTAGLDPDAPYTWTILLHHHDHLHYLVAGFVTDTVEVDVPLETHALGAPVWYEIGLQMRTAQGQVLSTSYKLLPETTTIQLQSWPGTVTLLVNQEAVLGEITLIVGQHYALEAPEEIFYKGAIGKFKNWVVTESWDGVHAAGETRTISDRQFDLEASLPPLTYIAFYDYDRPAYGDFLPEIGN